MKSSTTHVMPARRATNVSLPDPLVQEAKALGVNLSRAAEDGVAQAVKRARERRWLEANRDALAAYNEWIDANGVPLSEFRQF